MARLSVTLSDFDVIADGPDNRKVLSTNTAINVMTLMLLSQNSCKRKEEMITPIYKSIRTSPSLPQFNISVKAFSVI